MTVCEICKRGDVKLGNYGMGIGKEVFLEYNVFKAINRIELCKECFEKVRPVMNAAWEGLKRDAAQPPPTYVILPQKSRKAAIVIGAAISTGIYAGVRFVWPWLSAHVH